MLRVGLLLCAATVVGSLTVVGLASAAAEQAAESASRLVPEAGGDAPSGLAGRWRMNGAHRAEMRIKAEGAGWLMHLQGGASPNAGAATPADCELSAVGEPHDGQIAWRLVPFTSDVAVVTAEDLARHPATLTISLTGSVASVVTDYDGCGVGSDLSGRYVRVQATPSAPGRTRLSVGQGISSARNRYPDRELTIVPGYPWARFAVRGGPTLTFDGENEDLRDGSNTQKRIGDRVDWSELKPSLKIIRVEASR
jgi:hypothetical protein